MMEDMTFLLLVFTLLCTAIIVIALILNTRLKARLSLPGKAGFYIDTSRPGWRRAPKRVPIWGRREKRDRHLYRTWLAAKVRGRPDWEYALDGRTQVYIGRRSDNDIVLKDPAADARQAVIYLEGGRWRINNLSRSRPTRVNNRPITKQTLGNGCKIRMGNTELIFRELRKGKPR